MAKVLVLIAATTLVGGVRTKDNTVTPFEVAAGAELTEAVLARLGLDAEAVADLRAKGAVVEMDVRAAEASDAGADLSADLAAANKRADDAEARVKELEAKLAAGAKSAQQA